MRKFLVGLVALGGLAVATPAVAQGIYLEAPGVEVGVGRRYDRDYDRRYYRDYDRRRYRDDRAYGYRGEGCRTVIIRRDDGSVRRIRRCG